MPQVDAVRIQDHLQQVAGNDSGTITTIYGYPVKGFRKAWRGVVHAFANKYSASNMSVSLASWL
jgi:hypothetical protein